MSGDPATGTTPCPTAGQGDAHAWQEAQDAYAEAVAEIERLRRDCSEAYQAAGVMAHQLGYSRDTTEGWRRPMTRLLDNLWAAANGEPRPHDDLLPFVMPEMGGG